MKPTLQLAATTTPDGKKLVLSRHDRDFYLSIDQYPLMNSREQESELELARLGCQGLQGRPNPHVLIGGLGMGFTLRQTLELLPEKAKVTVAELVPEVIVWNRDLLGDLTRHAWQDPRVVVKSCDVCDIIQSANGLFDAILLDVDHGPSSMTNAQNARLYQPAGLHAMTRALKKEGCLANWSVQGDVQFEKRLKREKLFFRVVRVPAFKSSKTRSRCIWLIAGRKQGIVGKA